MTDRISLSLAEIESYLMAIIIDAYRSEFGCAPREDDYARCRTKAHKMALDFWRYAGGKISQRTG